MTVTPSLPPPLSGETYLCLFSETGGSLEFTTPANTDDGTEYTCTVDATALPLEGTKLGET